MKTNTHSRRKKIREQFVATRIDQVVYDALSAYAIEKGYTLSSAVYCVLLDWERKERRRKCRQSANEAGARDAS